MITCEDVTRIMTLLKIFKLKQRPLNRPQQLLFATVGSSWQGVPVMQSQVARLLSNTTVLRHACG